MEFRKILLENKEDVRRLSRLASSIVKEHYDPILGAEQNDYMIKMFQSVEGISEQLKKGYQYYMVEDGGGNELGFLAYYKRGEELYLSKFYLAKENRGRGLSHKMVEFLKEKAEKMGAGAITLNVNRNNDAILAYRKLGFVEAGTEVTDIGNGYVMDDYIYTLKVNY